MGNLRWHSLSDATLCLHHPESEDLLNTSALAPCLPHPRECLLIRNAQRSSPRQVGSGIAGGFSRSLLQVVKGTLKPIHP